MADINSIWHKDDLTDTDAIIERLKFGDDMDATTTDASGFIRSSKEVSAQMQDDGTYHFTVEHEIDDTYTVFSEAAFREVIDGDRDIWDGDLPNPLFYGELIDTDGEEVDAMRFREIDDAWAKECFEDAGTWEDGFTIRWVEIND